MRALGLFILCWASSAFAGTTDDAIPDARYLAYAEGFRPYTARIIGVLPDGTTPAGSCVLIADHWCLTAAHVVEDYAHGLVHASTGIRRIERIFPHREYTDGNYGWHDLALVRVDRPFGLAWYPPLSSGQEAIGATVSVAGYGLTGRLSTGHTHGDGALRAGTGRIVRFERGCIVLPAMRGGSPLPMCIAPGDSGGPLFVDGRLCGINSFTMKEQDGTRTRSKAGEESAHTRVSLYHDWYHEVMGHEFDATCSVVACDQSRSR
jgi:hypothetical protein